MVNLGQYDASALSAQAAFMHLDIPGIGPIWTDVTVDGVVTQEKSGIWLTGGESADALRLDRKLSNKLVRRTAAKGRRKGEQLTIEDGEEKENNLLVACTQKLQHMEFIDPDTGDARDITTVEGLLWMYDRFRYVRDQALDFIYDVGNWLGKP